MELFPEFDFLPKPDTKADLTQFEGPTLPPVDPGVMKHLMELATDFRALEPWREVHENDIFGIRDPESGALHLVSVLGRVGDGYSLHCHMPPEGIIFWRNALRGVDPGPHLAPGLAEIRLLECDFLDVADVTEDDYDYYKDYAPKKKLRKPNPVPCFRSYRPGFYPWFLEEEEAEKLITVFSLFFRFYEEIMPRKSEFYQWKNPFGSMPGIPVFVLGQDGDPDVTDDWEVRMEVLPTDCLAPLKERPDDDPRLEELLDLPIVNETWEIGSFYMTSPVFNGSRPYYPKTALCLRVSEVGSRCPCDPIVHGGENDSDIEAIREAFCELVAHCQYFPERVRVDSETTKTALQSCAEQFDIDLVFESQELMPVLVSEIIRSLEDIEPDWEEEVLNEVINAIPEEFHAPLDEAEMDRAVQELAEKVLSGDNFVFPGEDKTPVLPNNVIFADFASPRASGTGNGMD